ncbi:MAG: GtrA family protein [Pseudomonadota bacterium]
MSKLVGRHRQLLVYLAGGLLSALVDVGFLQMLLAEGADVFAATSAGFAAGLLFNYTFHARLTFDAPATAFNFVRFLCVVALNYAITLLFVDLSVQWSGGAMAGKLLSLPVVTLGAFVLGKHWVFK